MNLIEALILGSYVFTAGCYIWVFSIYKQLTNHMNARVKKLEEKVFDDPQGS
jgi:hypothetical protein